MEREFWTQNVSQNHLSPNSFSELAHCNIIVEINDNWRCSDFEWLCVMLLFSGVAMSSTVLICGPCLCGRCRMGLSFLLFLAGSRNNILSVVLVLHLISHAKKSRWSSVRSCIRARRRAKLSHSKASEVIGNVRALGACSASACYIYWKANKEGRTFTIQGPIYEQAFGSEFVSFNLHIFADRFSYQMMKLSGVKK